MARKSSKTAHVMNLLAGDEPESSKSEAAKENQAASLNTDSSETIKELTVLAHKASIQTQEGPLTPSPISIIDMSSSSSDPVSEKIRQQLEEEEGITTDSSQEIGIEENLTEAVDTESEKAVDEKAKSEKTEDGKIDVEKDEIEEIETEKTQESSDDFTAENETSQTNAVADDNNTSNTKSTGSTEPEALKSKESASVPEPERPTFKYLNVMEHVVQSKVHEYAEKFDICCCEHCIADITALTLTNLPPKYVVVKPPTASPLLNFYMNRYSQQVIVEITKACFTVKQNPHH